MNEIRFRINGKTQTVNVSPDETLLYVLRERLHMRGTKGEKETVYC